MLKKVIFITGSNGEMGQALIQKLNQKNIYNILTLDLDSSLRKYKIEKFFKGSILDKKLLNTIHENYTITKIYHLAAILSTKAEKNIQLANDVNIKGTKNILQLAIKQGKKQNKSIQFFFPSSIAVYNVDVKNYKSINETMIDKIPITIYGKAKLKCEKMGFECMQNNASIDFRSIRFPGIISASSIPSGGTSDYAPEMIHHAAKNLPYNCFVNKNSQLPFMVMPDAISAILNLMHVSKNKLSNYIYNITAFSQTTNDFFLKTKQYYPYFQMSYSINHKRQNIVDSWPNNINDEKARLDWDWEPKYNFNDAYKKYIVPEIKNII